MNLAEAVQLYLQGQSLIPIKHYGCGQAPANIALIKYWGKRAGQLNLPMNSSLSLAMGDRGARTRIELAHQGDNRDHIYLNDQLIDAHQPFAAKISQYLDMFGNKRPYFNIKTRLNIPHSAGLASSSAGFAALILAIDDLCDWQLSQQTLSKLARLGSGSAARSLWPGFVEWHAGVLDNGNDCYAEPLSSTMPDLRLGIVMIDPGVKAMSSRAGMLHTLQTSPLYPSWPSAAARDLGILKQALYHQDFMVLGQTAETNALAMHATMMAARPSLIYMIPGTLMAIQQVWQLRRAGIAVYYTQDAGANLKLLFHKDDQAKLIHEFPNLEVINPNFNSNLENT